MAEENKSSLDPLAALCKRRGFIYHSSEIYGGMPGFWDYGPLGCELKQNVKQAWWQFTVRGRSDVAGLDATIIMHPKIWKASGHLDTFADPMTMCKDCKKLMRADQIKDIYADQKKKPQPKIAGSDFFCPYCGGELTEPKPFNLMFKTVVGPIDDPSNVAYLRPETAQAIFAQFTNVLATSRQQVPFGIAQMGKSFRNEVTPRNYTFRSREFEQGRPRAGRLGLGGVAQVLGGAAQEVPHRSRPAAHALRRVLAEARRTRPLRPRVRRHRVRLPVRPPGAGGHRGPQRLRPLPAPEALRREPDGVRRPAQAGGEEDGRRGTRRLHREGAEGLGGARQGRARGGGVLQEPLRRQVRAARDRAVRRRRSPDARAPLRGVRGAEAHGRQGQGRHPHGAALPPEGGARQGGRVPARQEGRG